MSSKLSAPDVADPATGDRLRVLIVDDDPFVRRAVTQIVEEADGMVLVGEAVDGSQALAAVSELSPDVVMMDLEMPVMDGAEAVRRIRAAPEPPPILILTNHMDDALVAETLRDGAVGFMLKTAGPDELVAALRAAATGDMVLSGEVTRRMVDTFVSSGTLAPQTGAWAQELTAREQEVARAVAAGLSNQQIADDLFMSVSTVKTNVSRIMMKLGLANRVQVALLVHDVAPRRP